MITAASSPSASLSGISNSANISPPYSIVSAVDVDLVAEVFDLVPEIERVLVLAVG